MARKRLELRREEILAEAARQLQQRGPGRLRVSDVAGALGISTALIFYHFETKERMLAATFAHAAEHDLEQLDAVVSRGGPALDRLWAVLDLYAPTGEASGWRLWIDGWSEAQRDEQLLAVVRGLDRRWKRAVADLVAELGGTDPEGTAVRVTSLLDGLAVHRVVRRERLGARRLQGWVRAYVATELGEAPAPASAPVMLTHESGREE